MESLRQGLRESGYIEGENLAIELRLSADLERLRELAAELVQAQVNVIVSFGDGGPRAAQRATTQIPIVALADDIVGADMTAFTHSDRALTRRIVAAASDATAVNGWLVRQLPLLFQRAGIVDVRARGFFPLETDLSSFYASMADRCAEVAVKAGAITEFERHAWLDAFHEQGAQGPIIAGRLHIFVWGRKPA